MANDFSQLEWDDRLRVDCRALVQLALLEDLDGQNDWTTQAIVPETSEGTADIVAREAGVVAGLPTIEIVIDLLQADIQVETAVSDGSAVAAGAILASLSGNTRDILTAERTILNLLGRLMGIATLTNNYVEKVQKVNKEQGSSAQVYDTRKTTPGWRRLEKYAVKCGGAQNHRTGLFDAILIKDNHLAQSGRQDLSPAAAVQQAREFLDHCKEISAPDKFLVEIEVDTLEQLAVALAAQPDIVLLDNMSISELCEGVKIRNGSAPEVHLEASGGVNLDTISEIAGTGVDRISVGALTHSARSLDVGLDWNPA